MRIIHVLNDLRDNGNGINNVAVDVAIEQRRAGHEVVVASAGGEFERLLADHGVEHVEIDFRRRRPVALFRAVRALGLTVRDLRPDVMHAHTITPTVLGRVVARRRRPLLVATVHNEYQSGVLLMRLADEVVGVSEAVSRTLVNRGVDATKVSTVLNGTIGSRRRTPLSPDDEVDLPPHSVVAVGAVSERKGADVLLAAFEEVLRDVPTAHLFYVGNVDWPDVRDEAERKPWRDHVHFVGFQPHPQRYLRRASVFALASRRDPMPLVLLEALEAGVAVVGSNVDGIPEALGYGRAGLLVQVDDPSDLAMKIKHLLQDDEARSDLARAGAEYGLRFTVKAMAVGYLELYRAAGGSRQPLGSPDR